MTSKPTAEFRLDLAGAVIALDCFPAALAPAFERWFARPSAPAAPHIRLHFELVPHPDTLELPSSLLKTKTIAPGGNFDIADGLIRGRFDAGAATGEIYAKGALTRGLLMRVLEQIFYQAFHSAAAGAGLDAFLLHSSAVIAGGAGFLFVGPSEAGKTTVARNSGAYQVLGDEMTLVIPQPAGALIEGTPFNGTFKEKAAGRAPLRAVFLLEKAPAHRIRPIEPAEAASRIAAEVVPPVGLDAVPDGDTVPRMVDRAANLVDQAPVYCLECLPDAGFWPVIDEHFQLGLS